MTFLTELAEVLANANNAMAGVFLRSHAKEIVALVEAVQQEHGGEINNPRCPICNALAALDKEPIDPNKWAFDRGLESY
jgi:uncharacterized protein with PIN domain